MLIKTIALIFVIFALSRTVLRFKDRAIKLGELILWSTIWTCVLIFVFEPRISDKIARELGIGRGIDTVFFFAFIMIYYLLFRLYVKIDSLDKDITRLTIKISKKIHKDNKNLIK